MSGLYLIADDLTGALDSSAFFSARFGPIPVYLEAPADNLAGPLAVDLATRDGNGERAILAAAGLAPRMARSDIAFKKIDSLLRGNWASELAGLLAGGSFRTCILAPAFPAQGRITIAGRQEVHAAGARSFTVATDPAVELDRLGMRVVLANSAGARNPYIGNGAGPEVVIADAASDEDLAAIAHWGSAGTAPILWCGSAGLARALAGGQPPARIAFARRPLLAIIGSHHEVSLHQVERSLPRLAQGQHVVARLDAASRSEHSATLISAALNQHGECLLTFGFSPATSTARAAASIATHLQEVLPSIAAPATLAAAGGETLRAVCAALGVVQLVVDAEAGPGIPRSRIPSGAWAGVEVISKSGAFGDPDWLLDLLAASR
ncbi:MAG: four-carbon acid sugar kinase family protein [Lautropia sp.]